MLPRALVLSITLGIAACYSPKLDRCRVTCADSDHCPGAELCLADGFCHAPADDQLCNPDAEPPSIDAAVDAGPDATPPDAMPPLMITALSVGGDHACAIDGDGHLWCWGSNRYGQLGLDAPTMYRQTTPVMVDDDVWTAVDAGDAQTCGIKGGALHCWGANGYGEAADDDHGEDPVFAVEPADSGPSTGWIAVSAGGPFSCGIVDDAGVRTVYCWGADFEGHLGDGGGNDGGPTVRAIAATSEAASYTDWAGVSAGSNHACAWRAGGETYCWGRNAEGRIGDGTSGTDRYAPTRVVADADDGQNLYARVSAGDVATCGVATTGRLYCWGSSEATPRRASDDTTWTEISLGVGGRCGARGGTVVCWGDGALGANGAGTWSTADEPAEVVDLGPASLVSRGEHTACAAPVAGGVKCWGDNPEGELGIGSTSTKHVPTLIEPSDGAWTAVDVGTSHACGVHAATVMCWGWNGDRQAMNSDVDQGPYVPTAMGGLPAGVASAVSVGETSSCALIDGLPWCWGYNSKGEVGNGATPGGTYAPTQIRTTGTWTALAATHNAVCALRDGARVCWGDGETYGLGNGSTSSVLEPTVADATTWSEVGLGYRFGCGIDVGGALSCWGTDYWQNQADGVATQVDAPTPHVLMSGEDFDDLGVAWAGDHVCAIRSSDRDLYCWGRNDYGQLGLADSVPPLVMTSIDTGEWTAVDAAWIHTCGVKNDGASMGELWCWGNEYYDQLGLDIETSQVEAPTRVGVAQGLGTGWADVSAGRFNTCGLRGGNLYCWGPSVFGEVGDGSHGWNTAQEVDFP